MRLICILVSTFYIFLFLLIPLPLNAQPSNNSLTIVLLPALNLEDLSKNGELKKLSQTSAVGLMNSNTNGKHLPNSYLTLSAGKKLISPKAGVLGLQVDEMIDGKNGKSLYERYQRRSVDEHNIVLPYLQSILNINPDIQPPLLGDILTANHIPLLLLGNQDLPGQLSRPGVLFAMDSSGRVDKGIIDNKTYVTSSFSPTFYTTNYHFLLDQITNFSQEYRGVAVLDLGDLVRLDTVEEYLSPVNYLKYRDIIIEEISGFLGSLTNIMADNHSQLLIITPFPGKKDLTIGNSLVPVLFWQPDIQPGLLVSSSTKRLGLITNLDIAPTILHKIGVKNTPSYVGSVVNTTSYPSNINYLQDKMTVYQANYQQRPLLLKAYILLTIVFVLLTIGLILFKIRRFRYGRPFLLAITGGPLLYLYLTLIPSTNILVRTAFLLLTMILMTYLLEKITNPLISLSILYILTSFSIIADLLGGAPLMKGSLLGYDPISGARYYGLGNEYMGVLLGSTLMGFTMFLDIISRKAARFKGPLTIIIIIAFPLVIFLVASPAWGTNVGGGITFFLSYSLLLLLFSKKSIKLKHLAGLALSVTAALTLLFYLDLQRPLEVQSHIGLTARLIQEKGLTSLIPIISRKLSMNYKLLHYSIWSRVFLTFTGTLALTLYKPPGLLKRILQDYPHLKAGLIAGISGSFIALLCNDSGIVAAATSMLYIAPTLLFLITKML